MLSHTLYASLLVFATVLVHAVVTAGVLGWLHSADVGALSQRGTLMRSALLALLVFVLSLAAVAESAIWAGFYVIMDVLPSFEQALYFSLVTLTTLGYGDVTLDENWRVMSAFQAANGVILFGWTTAIIVSVVQRVFQPPGGRVDDE